jgi:hypothetical protein
MVMADRRLLRRMFLKAIPTIFMRHPLFLLRPMPDVIHELSILEHKGLVRLIHNLPVMGGEDESRVVFGLHLVHQLDDAAPRPGIKVGGGLIGQNKLRLIHKSPRNGHALTLPAAELVGATSAVIGKTDGLQHLKNALFPLPGGRPGQE